MSPDYIEKLEDFLNVSYFKLEIEDRPPWVQKQMDRGKDENSIRVKYRFRYLPELEHLPDKDVVFGYTQCMRYFLPFGSEIRDMFKINDNLVARTQGFLHSFTCAPKECICWDTCPPG